MTHRAIEVDNLGKQYRLGQSQAYRTLRESLVDLARAPARAFESLTRPQRNAPPPEGSNMFWALRGVEFTVDHGEVVGIIGRNGAGKSTLLKILSRITEPTTGRVLLRGRVGSLLEVGTGFHPELTGRENVFLNGAILGMRRGEILRNFDAIIDFAEVERFMDTPVKHYSSGMYLRLAFSVAAHLNPEILLVDEVLAVGDASFQEKCLGKMGDVARQGRTVLFVSHNLGALANLCPRAILLTNGQVRTVGPSRAVIDEYIALGKEASGERIWPNPAEAPGNDRIRLHAVRVISGDRVSADVDISKDIHIQVEYRNLREGSRMNVGLHLVDKLGIDVLQSANMHSANLGRDEWYGTPAPPGLYRSTCVIPANFLNDGRYTVHIAVRTDVMQMEAWAGDVVSFAVHDTGEMRKEYGGAWLGVVRPRLAWRTQPVVDSAPIASHRVRNGS